MDQSENSSQQSYDQDNFSEEEYRVNIKQKKNMELRGRIKKSYRELEVNFEEDLEEVNENLKCEQGIGETQESCNQQEENDPYQEEPSSIFYPDIDVILWRRTKETEEGEINQYLVKYKEYSYLHCEWLDENEIVNSRTARNKLNRFNKNFEKKLQEIEIDSDINKEENYFDPSYIEVDRILSTTELFPIIHLKKANETKGKWSELLVTVCSKLLNFTKDNVHYGIFFSEPVNPDRDGVPNYRKIISQPMDLGTVLNRVYLDYYNTFGHFWYELGLIFKNCRKFNKDSESEIRIIGDSLREAAIYLYKQWYSLQKERYIKVKSEYEEKLEIIQSEYQNIEQDLQIQEQQNKEQQIIQQQIQQQKKDIYFQLQRQQRENEKKAINDNLSLSQRQKIQEKFNQKLNQIKEILQRFDLILNCKQKEGNLCDLKSYQYLIMQFLEQNQEILKNHKVDDLIQFDLEKMIGKMNVLDYLKQKGMISQIPQEILKACFNEQQLEKINENYESKYSSDLNSNLNQMEIDQSLRNKEFYLSQKTQQIHQISNQLPQLNQNENQLQLNQTQIDSENQLDQSLLQQNNVQQIQINNYQEENQSGIQQHPESLEHQKDEKMEDEPKKKKLQLTPQILRKLPLALRKKLEPIIFEEEVEKFNPENEPFNMNWIQDEQKSAIPVEEEQPVYLGEQEQQTLDFNVEVDKLYLVKWKNLSYLDATWEPESLIACPEKINDFRMYNRALDKETRQLIQSQAYRHKTLLDLMQNPKKKQKYGQAAINDVYNKLYGYDQCYHKQPMQYTMKTQPVYKEKKLLRSYQLESLNWLIQAWYHRRNVILADEMGLGKTIQSMAFLNHLINLENCRGPFLVIAPLSTLEFWKRTMQEWTNLNSILYYDLNSIEGRTCIRAYEWFHIDISTKGSILNTHNDIYKFQILITSYEVFLQDFNNVLINIPFQYIVVDEAHRLKNQNAKILVALKKMPCKRILLLTGTPIQNNTDELWSLLNYIEPQKFSRLEDFRENFGDLTSADQIEKLHKMLKPYLLRRMKEDVEQSIPPLQETIIDIEMTTIQKTVYRALYDKNKSMLVRGGVSNEKSQFTTSLNCLEMQLRKCCNHPCLIKEIESEFLGNCITNDSRFQKIIESSGKMLLLDKLLPKLKAENKKVLIFSQFVMMLSLLEEYLKFRQYKYEKIQGSIKSKERQNAIDRFNDPTKKRDVFLLSTKAGGQGINLSSANAVIIFDSDWNPQNDVQATARAHRIGQQSEVQVYRLITSRTYEAEMFERSTKKLGLDQAIFMGGNFQSTQIDGKPTNGSANPNNKIGADGNQNIKGQNNGTLQNNIELDKKLSKNEIEVLLKKGILGLIDESDQKQEAFFEDNIEQILEKNTRIAKYSLINGTYSFSKSTFVSKNADTSINIDDPKFWENMLKNTETNSQKLLSQLKKNSQIEQQSFMASVSQEVQNLIESKLNILGYNPDDEKNLMEILNLIYSRPKVFQKSYRDLATQWLYEIQRPSRRFKKMTPQDLEVQFRDTIKIKRQPVINNQEEDAEKIFDDNENSSQNSFLEEEGVLLSDQENQISKRPTKITSKLLDERLRKFCSYCERNKCVYQCQGPCRRSFHGRCRELVEEQGAKPGQDENDILFPLHEHTLEDEKLKKTLIEDWICSDCSKNEATCFRCKKKGKYFSSEEKKKMKGESEEFSQDALKKCLTTNCNKFFHLSCLEGDHLVKYWDRKKSRFRCPLHYCNKCSVSGDSLILFQCFRCPISYHPKCCNKEKIHKISKKLIVCHKHKIQQKDVNSSTKINMNQLLKQSQKDRRKNLLEKRNKYQQQILYNDDGKLVSKRDEKIRRKEQVQLERTQILEENSDLFDERPIKKKKKLSKQEKPKNNGSEIKKQQATPKLMTFEEFNIPPPEKFDYKNYEKSWCRYCGARIASNFTKGPWGSRTLCTVHYIDWNQKKKLNLSKFKDLPSTPINMAENTELSYMTKIKLKNPQYDPYSILYEEKPTKKVKVEDQIEEGEIVDENQKLNQQN